MATGKSVGILGAGAFGTSLAICYIAKHNVSLFSVYDDHITAMKLSGKNEFLPGFLLPDIINIDNLSNIKGEEFDYILWCFPTEPSCAILNSIKHLIDGNNIVICSKGFAIDGNFLAHAFQELLPNSTIACLAGPNFASELASCKISAANIASDDINISESFASNLSTESFKLFPIDDKIGAQLCGAAKNVIAIACGMVLGFDLGKNTHSALLSFAIAEITRLGMAIGAKPATFLNLCGIGDLVLTTSSCDSRNTALGKKIANGLKIESIIKSEAAVCEGYGAARHIFNLAKDNKIEMPICETVYRILFEHASRDSILNIFQDNTSKKL
ncbi:MAG: NAD(P)H-dependent glycerol-3-phosphate dehydrogenase [Holosporales bacterium]|nr:NAD(P)H-dependent glycerol-3-phosphate dehydrogenase [Holosporales bacterium]